MAIQTEMMRTDKRTGAISIVLKFDRIILFKATEVIKLPTSAIRAFLSLFRIQEFVASETFVFT